MKMMITQSQSQMKAPHNICFLILILGLLSTNVESLRFEVKSFNAKCLAEEMKRDAMSVGKYHIINETEGYPLPDSHIIAATVMSESGKNYHKSENVTEGNFVFHAEEDEKYYTCFFAPSHEPPVTLTIEFEWKSGIIAKDWSNVAKKGSVELMELELKKMCDVVQSVHDEMSYLREREMEQRELNVATTSNMTFLSFLSLVICISVAGFQFWHLKSYFQKKKLI
ncbi:hypothetical protein Leryth_015699 [Lithospermum erythrorhizon]|nr:hypothetical protein Leryth_015699 [Lithospermum erythrorhizon]